MPIRFGYTLSSEEHDPRSLVTQAIRAEESAFDFCSISDHFHPWVEAQGHSPFVWSVLGAVAHATDRIELGVGVSCPTVRVHPAIVAQAAATVSLLSEGRFFLGVGSGEALNEHIFGDRWPAPETRLAMLEEAVEVMRGLWSGRTVDHEGRHYRVENARLFDPPTAPLPVVVSGFGAQAADLAARIGDGLWTSGPTSDLIDRFHAAGGRGPRYGQIHVCVGPDVEACRRTVHEVWPNAAMSGQIPQELPTWTHFEQVARLVRVEDAVDGIPCGPDPEPIVKAVQAYVDSGYDHVYLHQIGPDHAALFELWDRELRSALRELSP
jgi:G6PDH family F420-dependent oxidoreductase